jgi:hypothetical protein
MKLLDKHSNVPQEAPNIDRQECLWHNFSKPIQTIGDDGDEYASVGLQANPGE